MASPSEIRKNRLKSDYGEMLNMKGSILQWKATKGTEPYVEEYRLTVNIRSVIGPGPDYRDQHELRLEIPGNYPLSAPEIFCVSKPHPYHPNWWPHAINNGRWCSGDWHPGEGLGSFVQRMLRVLQFDPEVININSPTSSEQNNWYQEHRSSGYFPTDRQALPDPSGKKFRWEEETPKPKLRFL